MSEEKTPEVQIQELQEQVKNLNLGIATYRDESKESKAALVSEKAELVKAKEELAKLKTEDDDKNKKKEVQLNPADQEKLDSWAKEHGFVTKAEMDAQKVEIYTTSLKNIESQAVTEFLAAHPVYDKDEEWAKVKEKFELYKTPTSLAGYRSLLVKIHGELNPSDDGSAKARAEIERKNRLGLGGRSQKTGEGEETIEDLQVRYPKLTRSQIETRMAEIKALYKKKE